MRTIPYAVIESHGEELITSIEFDCDESIKQYQTGSTSDAVVIVEWSDFKIDSAHFVLLLIQWTSESSAERVGTVSDYGQDWKPHKLRRISRRRRQFELQ